MALLGWALGIAAGIAGASCLPILPPLWSLAALAALAVVAWARRWAALGAVALGLAWGIGHGHWAARSLLPTALEGETLTLSGYVDDLPASYRDGERGVQRFAFRVTDSSPTTALRRVRLGWYGGPPVQAGTRWRLSARLKRPHGFANPGGFDYQAWLFRRGLDATGYVVDDPARGGGAWRLDDAAPAGRLWGPALGSRLREALRARLDRMLADRPFAPMIAALLVGDRHRIDAAQWEVLQGTGVSHLVAISGLHIGLATLWGFWLCAGLARLAGQHPRRWPAQSLGALGGLLCAGTYAALAGFALPTQRALIMAAVAMLAPLLRRRMRAGTGIGVALCAVLVLDPLAARGADSWLSFVAVAALLFGLAGFRERIASSMLRAQWLVTAALALPLLVFFGQFPWLSPLANLVAVPWVSLVVVPLCLASLPLLWWPSLAAGALSIAHAAWSGLYAALSWSYHAVEQPLWNVPADDIAATTLAAAGTLWLLLPRGMPARWLGALMCLALVYPADANRWLLRVVALDVGQGLSVVVRTRAHVLLYDTGARFSARFDAGSAVVVPYLRHAGVARIDRVILSHDDIDHTGGFASVAHALEIGQVSGRASATGGHPVTACRAGMHWRWDGVRFDVLHPAAGARYDKENDRSCVLLVRAGKVRVLLPGDIERDAERDLLAAQAASLRSVDVLTVPHHGSRTSSSPAFVRSWRPRYAVYSAGYRNRYFHPHAEVVRRWQQAGAHALHTVDGGAIEFVVGPDGDLRPPTQWRRQAWRYWWRWGDAHGR